MSTQRPSQPSPPSPTDAPPTGAALSGRPSQPEGNAPVKIRSSLERRKAGNRAATFAVLWFLLPLVALIGLAFLGAP